MPDVWGFTTRGSYSGRAVSVAAASTILQTIDSAIQSIARDLGIDGGAKMNAGDDIAFSLASNPVKASTLVWAGANNVRHVEEWAATAGSFDHPQNEFEVNRRARQRASMAPIAALLGIPMPVIENVSYELFQFLTMISEEQGSYDRLELHVLRIGQDLVVRAGLNPAPIGVTGTEIAGAEAIKGLSDSSVVISDGVGRTASSIEDIGHIFNVRPLGFGATAATPPLPESVADRSAATTANHAASATSGHAAKENDVNDERRHHNVERGDRPNAVGTDDRRGMKSM